MQRGHLLTPDQRDRIAAATNVLRAQWDVARSSEGVVRPEDAALCSNLVVAGLALDDLPAALELARQGLGAAPQDVELTKRAALEPSREMTMSSRAISSNVFRSDPTRPFSVFATTPHAATGTRWHGSVVNRTIPFPILSARLL